MADKKLTKAQKEVVKKLAAKAKAMAPPPGKASHLYLNGWKSGLDSLLSLLDD